MKKSETHFMLNNFFSENLAVDAIMCKIIVYPDRPQIALHGARTLHAG